MLWVLTTSIVATICSSRSGVLASSKERPISSSAAELLIGIAQIDDSLSRAVAKAVFNAANWRIEFWLHEGLGTKVTANS